MYREEAAPIRCVTCDAALERSGVLITERGPACEACAGLAAAEAQAAQAAIARAARGRVVSTFAVGACALGALFWIMSRGPHSPLDGLAMVFIGIPGFVLLTVVTVVVAIVRARRTR